MNSVLNAKQKYHKIVMKNEQFSVDADEQAVMHF
jgi:hypothetical protein